MSFTTDFINNIFSENGELAKSIKGFELRPAQIEMACLIWNSLVERVPAIVEAGTGTGKTLSYLVPLIISGRKCVISTGTKNLQEQIFFKDVPLVSKVTGQGIKSMLMKGRKNYLCLHRYNQFFSGSSLFDSVKIETKDKFEQWIEKTEFADRAELQWLPDDDPVWDYVSSTSDQCLGSDCMHMKDCYLNMLRKKAAQSDIIIVNHHLFFADLMVKRGGFGEIIPRFQIVVFDEAHKIEDIATDYLGITVSTGQLADLIRDVERGIGKTNEFDHRDTTNQLNILRSLTEDLLGIFINSGEKGRLDTEDLKTIHEGPVKEIRLCLKQLSNKIDQVLADRAEELERSLEAIFYKKEGNWLNWYEVRKRGIVFHSSPLDISESMGDLLYTKVKSVIFTSATISVNGGFDYISSRLGIPENRLEGIYPSHFDFSRQTLMYIPDDIPSPNASDFGERVAGRSIEILKITSGRALILFTSYSVLNTVHRLLEGQIPYRIYKQGDAPRSTLLDNFKQDTHSVLLATSSFWQGVDVPGEALSCLIVDKLPFDSPGDPLVAARIDSLRSRGKNPFMEYQLPSAIISLKQGLGRLIRKSTDRGVISILDKRINESRYGRFFMDSLPKIPVTKDLSDIKNFFET